MASTQHKSLQISIPSSEHSPTLPRSTRRPSLTQTLDVGDLTHPSTRHKLYAALSEQSNGSGSLLGHYRQYRAQRLDRDAEDKALLQTLFNWTDDAAREQKLDFEIIVGDKFSMTSSANNTPRGNHMVGALSTASTPRSQPVGLDEILRHKYEAYKQNYNNKVGNVQKSCAQALPVHKSGALTGRQRVGSYESAEAEQKHDENKNTASNARTLSKYSSAHVMQKLNAMCGVRQSLVSTHASNANVRETALRQRNENDSSLSNTREGQIVRLKHCLNMRVA